MDIPITELVNLIVNGGGSAVLLYLLIREQQRAQRIEDRLIEVLRELANLRQRVTQEFDAIQASNRQPPK